METSEKENKNNILPDNQNKKLEEEKTSSNLSVKEVQEQNRPPVLLQRTELLKALENHNVEFLAVIDSYPAPTSKEIQF